LDAGRVSQRKASGDSYQTRTAPLRASDGFRRCERSDLDWIFCIQTERIVEKDNTVTIRDQRWRMNKPASGTPSQVRP
jgi:hypothetical protein